MLSFTCMRLLRHFQLPTTSPMAHEVRYTSTRAHGITWPPDRRRWDQPVPVAEATYYVHQGSQDSDLLDLLPSQAS